MDKYREVITLINENPELERLKQHLGKLEELTRDVRRDVKSSTQEIIINNGLGFHNPTDFNVKGEKSEIKFVGKNSVSIMTITNEGRITHYYFSRELRLWIEGEQNLRADEYAYCYITRNKIPSG
jgi:hypothetical protein